MSIDLNVSIDAQTLNILYMRSGLFISVEFTIQLDIKINNRNELVMNRDEI